MTVRPETIRGNTTTLQRCVGSAAREAHRDESTRPPHQCARPWTETVHGSEDEAYGIGDGTPKDRLHRYGCHEGRTSPLSGQLGTRDELRVETTEPTDEKRLANRETLSYW